MRGKIKEQESLFACVRLEDMVPAEHLLRLIKKHIDFSFIDKHTEKLYSDKGRPSIDPQVLVRMMLIGYLYGITSERRLCQEVHLNLAYRWFCGLDLEDKVPDHSSFSKNRNGRFSETNLFRELFNEVVKQSLGKGLIRGKHWSTDATLVAANASMGSLEPIVVPFTQEEYIEQLDKSQPTCSKSSEHEHELKKKAADLEASVQAQENNNEQQKAESSSKEKKLSTNDTHRSKTDPDARIGTRWGSKKELSYSDNILVDGDHNIILDVEVTTPSNTEEGLSSVEMIKRTEFSLGVTPESLGADSSYGRGMVVSGLKETGVQAYIPRPKETPRANPHLFSKEAFRYDEHNDYLICPNNQVLKPVKDRSKPGLKRYISTKKQCEGCPLKSQCTSSKFRSVRLNRNQEALDWAETLRQQRRPYKRAQYMRKKIERLFGEAKEQMGLRRAFRRGKEKVLEQFLMTALAQNIKRIVKASGKGGATPVALRAQEVLSILLYKLFARIKAQFTVFRCIFHKKSYRTNFLGRFSLRPIFC